MHRDHSLKTLPILALASLLVLIAPTLGAAAGEKAGTGEALLNVRDVAAGSTVHQSSITPADNPSTGPVNFPAARSKELIILLSESFEESWPTPPWRVTHPEEAADVDWGRTDFRASKGSHSIRCAETGPDAPGPGAQVPPHTASWTIVGPFDLSDAVTGTLSFDLWLRTEQFYDLVMWLASTDGEVFSGSATSTDSSGWSVMTVDLNDWGEAGDVTGNPLVWIAFVYQSDHSNQFEGAYIDNVILVADDGTQVATGYTYTTDEDFELGTSVGLESSEDSLRLSDEWNTHPHLWVPNTGSGTVSKIDTDTGDELARYRTGPDRELEPSPTAVDLYGDCWVGNRGAGTLVKIGLPESGGCVDRDRNGVIDSSRDTDADGLITGDELLDWGSDECVLYEVVLVAGEEGLYVPGDDHDLYQNNHLQAVAVDAANDVWAGVATSSTLYRVAGQSGEILDTVDVSTHTGRPYLGVIDRSGALWYSAWPDASVLRFDPSTRDLREVQLEHGSRGMALDGADHLFTTGFSDSRMSCIDLASGEPDWEVAVDWQSNGIAVTSDGDVWVAAPGSGTIRRFSNDGFFRSRLPIANGPTAVAVDGAGKVWVLGVSNDVIVRIDPAANSADLQREIRSSGGHDGAGDMTGIVARSITSHFGSWTVIHDALAANAPWGKVSWTGTEPEGTVIAVRVRSSEDMVSWSSWEQVVRGNHLTATPAGRYLQVTVALQHNSGEDLPVLDELRIEPAGVGTRPEAGLSWTPSEPHAGQEVQFIDTSSGDPTSWSWDFGDGGSSELQNPVHTYAEAGVFDVTLEVANDAGVDSVSETITVSAGTTECIWSYWVPVVSHADGANGSLWTSDLGLLGVGTDTVSAELRFHGPDGVSVRSHDVAPKAMVNLVDVVSWIDESAEGSGALELCADGPLIVASRTAYHLEPNHPCMPDGTFGQYLEGEEATAGLAAGQSGVLPHLLENTGFRTNIGLLNAGTATAKVDVTLFDGEGLSLESFTITLEPGQWQQEYRPFFNRVGREDLDAAWAQVDVLSGDGVFAYASVLDNNTNDATTVPMHFSSDS
jgi:hypothetical protein